MQLCVLQCQSLQLNVFARPLTITVKLPFVAFVHVTMIRCVKFKSYFTVTFYYFHKSIIKIILSKEEQVFKVSLVSVSFSEMKEVHPSILCFTWSAQKLSNTLFGKSSLCDVTNYTNTWLVRSSKLKGRLPVRCLFQPPDCSVFVTFHFCHLAYHEHFCRRLWTDFFCSIDPTRLHYLSLGWQMVTWNWL